MRIAVRALRIVTVAWLLAMAARNSPAQDLVWARQLGGLGAGTHATAVVVDGSGNVYATGYFTKTVDFDPGPGTYNLVSSTQAAAFVSKFDPNGNLVWARELLGFGATYADAIAVDGTGNVYTTGTFFSTTDFDPGPGTYSLGPNGGHFLSKLDSTGNFVWAIRFGSGTNNTGYSIDVDGAGNVYSSGEFAGVADFDPGPGVFNLTTTGSGDVHAFASKLDSNGNFVWAKELQAPGHGLSIAVDGGGNVFTTGSYSDGAFVSKLDSAGNLVWAKQLGDSNYFASGRSIAVDSAGNVIIAGQFQNSGDFDPGPGTYTLTSAGGDDGFISKLDSAGNFVWAKRLGGAGTDQATSVAVDVGGSVYSSGSFGTTVDFDPGPSSYNLTSPTPEATFVSKLDGAGNFVWAGQIGRADPSSRQGALTLDSSGLLYTTGSFFGVPDFDPSPLMYFMDTAGDYDAYLAVLIQPPAVSFTGKNALTWSPAFDGTSFNIYRSDSGLPGTFDCFASHQTNPLTTDLGDPASGTLYAFLVTAITAGGQEGNLGFGAEGGIPIERPNTNPCP